VVLLVLLRFQASSPSLADGETSFTLNVVGNASSDAGIGLINATVLATVPEPSSYALIAGVLVLAMRYPQASSVIKTGKSMSGCKTKYATLANVHSAGYLQLT